MAEVLVATGAIASVMGIAAEGLKLSKTLNEYTTRIQCADKDVKDAVDHVHSTAVLLQEFGNNLELEKKVRVCSMEFYTVSSRCAEDCRVVFKEMELIFPAAVSNDHSESKAYSMRRRDKLRWPFKEQKLTLLKNNLDRLKLHLNSMQLIMIHARELKVQEIADSERRHEGEQKRLEVEYEIRMLELKRVEAERKHRALQEKGASSIKHQQYSGAVSSHAENSRMKRPWHSPILEKPEPIAPVSETTTTSRENLIPGLKRSASEQSDDEKSGATQARTHVSTQQEDRGTSQGIEPIPVVQGPGLFTKGVIYPPTDPLIEGKQAKSSSKNPQENLVSELETILGRIATAQENIAFARTPRYPRAHFPPKRSHGRSSSMFEGGRTFSADAESLDDTDISYEKDFDSDAPSSSTVSRDRKDANDAIPMVKERHQLREPREREINAKFESTPENRLTSSRVKTKQSALVLHSQHDRENAKNEPTRKPPIGPTIPIVVLSSQRHEHSLTERNLDADPWKNIIPPFVRPMPKLLGYTPLSTQADHHDAMSTALSDSEDILHKGRKTHDKLLAGPSSHSSHDSTKKNEWDRTVDLPAQEQKGKETETSDRRLYQDGTGLPDVEPDQSEKFPVKQSNAESVEPPEPAEDKLGEVTTDISASIPVEIEVEPVAPGSSESVHRSDPSLDEHGTKTVPIASTVSSTTGRSSRRRTQKLWIARIPGRETFSTLFGRAKRNANKSRVEFSSSAGESSDNLDSRSASRRRQDRRQRRERRARNYTGATQQRKGVDADEVKGEPLRTETNLPAGACIPTSSAPDPPSSAAPIPPTTVGIDPTPAVHLIEDSIPRSGNLSNEPLSPPSHSLRTPELGTLLIPPQPIPSVPTSARGAIPNRPPNPIPVPPPNQIPLPPNPIPLPPNPIPTPPANTTSRHRPPNSAPFRPAMAGRYDTAEAVGAVIAKDGSPTIYEGWTLAQADDILGMAPRWSRIIRIIMNVDHAELKTIVASSKERQKGLTGFMQYQKMSSDKQASIDSLLMDRKKEDKDPRVQWGYALIWKVGRHEARGAKRMAVVFKKKLPLHTLFPYGMPPIQTKLSGSLFDLLFSNTGTHNDKTGKLTISGIDNLSPGSVITELDGRRWFIGQNGEMIPIDQHGRPVVIASNPPPQMQRQTQGPPISMPRQGQATNRDFNFVMPQPPSQQASRASGYPGGPLPPQMAPMMGGGPSGVVNIVPPPPGRQGGAQSINIPPIQILDNKSGKADMRPDITNLKQRSRARTWLNKGSRPRHDISGDDDDSMLFEDDERSSNSAEERRGSSSRYLRSDTVGHRQSGRSSTTIELPRREFNRRVQTISDRALEKDLWETELRRDRIDREINIRSSDMIPRRTSGDGRDISSYPASRDLPRYREWGRERPPPPPLPPEPAVSGPYYGRHGAALRQPEVPPYAFGLPKRDSMMDNLMTKWTIVGADSGRSVGLSASTGDADTKVNGIGSAGLDSLFEERRREKERRDQAQKRRLDHLEDQLRQSQAEIDRHKREAPLTRG